MPRLRRTTGPASALRPRPPPTPRSPPLRRRAAYSQWPWSSASSASSGIARRRRSSASLSSADGKHQVRSVRRALASVSSAADGRPRRSSRSAQVHERERSDVRPARRHRQGAAVLEQLRGRVVLADAEVLPGHVQRDGGIRGRRPVEPQPAPEVSRPGVERVRRECSLDVCSGRRRSPRRRAATAARFRPWWCPGFRTSSAARSSAACEVRSSARSSRAWRHRRGVEPCRVPHRRRERRPGVVGAAQPCEHDAEPVVRLAVAGVRVAAGSTGATAARRCCSASSRPPSC